MSSMEFIDGIRYCWFQTPKYSGNGSWRALNILIFLIQLVGHRRMLARFAQTGSVIASSTYPFDVVVARSIARAAKADLTYEVHDLWPLSPIELGKMPVKHPFIRLVQWAENFAYRHADLVISVLPLAEPYMRQHGLAPGKFRHVPNGIVMDEWVEGADLPDAHRMALAELRKQNRFLIGYAGSHGIANSLDTVLHAADRLRQHPIAFVLVGQGPEKQRLEQLASDLQLTNVMFLPPVTKSAIPALLSRMDCLLIALRPSWIFSLGISPNKLMDYMMSGRPIIQAIDAGNDMVAESGCGISVPGGAPAALATAALDMAAKSIVERQEMGRKGKEYVQNNHDFRILARQFLSFISPHPDLQRNLGAVAPLQSSGEYRPSQSL